MNEDASKTKRPRSIADRAIHALGGLSALIVLCLAILLSFSGCGKPKEKSSIRGVALPSGRISTVEVRDALEILETSFLSKIEGAMAQIYSMAPDRRMEKMALLGRIRTAHAINKMLDQERPIASLFDIWALGVRLRYYFETGEGRLLFGEHQSIALEAVTQVEAEIELVVKTLLGETVVADTREHIHTFARSRPIRGAFFSMIVYATSVQEAKKGAIGNALAIPMAPFKALGGVERTPAAINRFTNTAADFSDVVEEFPASARWQLLLLLYDLQDTQMVESFLDSISEFSESSARIADSAEKFPKQLSDNLSELIDEIDSKQGNLQKTLEQAGETANIVGDNLEKVDEVSNSLGHTVKSVNEAAVAWEKAAEATVQIVRELAEDADPNEPFDINDYRHTAKAVTKAANELRELLDEIREFANSDDFDEIASVATGVSTRLTWRATLFALIVFVLAVAYRIIAVRITDRKK